MNISRLFEPPVQLRHACLLLQTSKVEEIKIFCNGINRLVLPPDSDRNQFLHNRIAIMSIPPSAKPNMGFLFVGPDQDGRPEIQDPDNRPIHFCSEMSEFLFIELSSSFIPILRSFSIEKTKDFYSRYAKCQEERHGKGPRHYSMDWVGPFTEIYPQRKNDSETTELIFQTNTVSD